MSTNLKALLISTGIILLWFAAMIGTIKVIGYIQRIPKAMSQTP